MVGSILSRIWRSLSQSHPEHFPPDRFEAKVLNCERGEELGPRYSVSYIRGEWSPKAAMTELNSDGTKDLTRQNREGRFFSLQIAHQTPGVGVGGSEFLGALLRTLTITDPSSPQVGLARYGRFLAQGLQGD